MHNEDNGGRFRLDGRVSCRRMDIVPFRPPVLAVFNHKGGVAKTTSAANLAVCLAAHGLKVLLVDLDAQGNATCGFGHRPLPPVGAADVLAGRIGLAETRIDTPFPGLSLLPASEKLRDADLDLAAGPRPRTRLAETLAATEWRGLADLVVIDCPPAFGLVTVNALAAASAVLIPSRPDTYSHEGLVNTWYEIKRIREADNAALAVAGILLVMTDEDPTSQDAARAIRAEFGEAVLARDIPAAAMVGEAAALSLPVVVLEPDGGVGGAYVLATAEILARLERQQRPGLAVPPHADLGQALNTLRQWRAEAIALRRLPGGDGWAANLASSKAEDEPPPPRSSSWSWPTFAAGAVFGALLAGIVALLG